MKKSITEYLQCSNCGSINKKRFWCNDDDLYIDNNELNDLAGRYLDEMK